MDTSDIVWLVVAVLVLLALAALLASVLRKRKAERVERDRLHAQQLRREASAHRSGLVGAEQEAAQAEARARKAKLEAERAEQQAMQAKTSHQMQEAAYEDRLREADRLDPDVDTSSADYRPGETSPDRPEDLPDDGSTRVR